MANVPISNLTTTWNNGATTFSGVKLNVTDTASASGSLLMDLQVGGTSKCNVTKGGHITSGASFKVLSDTEVQLRSIATLGWSSSSIGGVSDVFIVRDGAAGILAQRNAANAQTFRIYNTYTDASNYERAKIEWDTNVLKIGTEKAGTGTARALELQTNGTTRLTLGATGDLFTQASTGVYIHIRATASTSASLNCPADGVLLLTNYNINDFNRLQFGGTSSSFPALKRSSTTLQARLADDSDYGSLQGKLTTETAYTAGAPTATGYIVLYDSTGTAYKVPAEAL